MVKMVCVVGTVTKQYIWWEIKGITYNNYYGIRYAYLTHIAYSYISKS